MKKLNLFELGLRRVLFLLLSMLGFTSCVKDSPCEYGSPVTGFKVVGQVTNQNGTGIPNVGVVVKTEGYQIADTLRTDANGDYSNFIETLYPLPKEIDVVFVDTDGQDNGSYQSTTINHPIKGVDPSSGLTIEQKIDATLTEKENN